MARKMITNFPRRNPNPHRLALVRRTSRPSTALLLIELDWTLRPRVHVELKNVRAGVMAHDVQCSLGDGRAPVVHVCVKDALLVAQGTGDDFALWRNHHGIARID